MPNRSKAKQWVINYNNYKLNRKKRKVRIETKSVLTMESAGQGEPHPGDGHRALVEQRRLVGLVRPEQAVPLPGVVEVLD